MYLFSLDLEVLKIIDKKINFALGGGSGGAKHLGSRNPHKPFLESRQEDQFRASLGCAVWEG